MKYFHTQEADQKIRLYYDEGPKADLLIGVAVPLANMDEKIKAKAGALLQGASMWEWERIDARRFCRMAGAGNPELWVLAEPEENGTENANSIKIQVNSLQEAIVLEQALADYKMDLHHKARAAKEDKKNAKYEHHFKECSGLAQALQNRLFDSVPNGWKEKPLAEHFPNGGGPTLLKGWPGSRCSGCGWYADVDHGKDDWMGNGWCDKRGVEANRNDPACEKHSVKPGKEKGENENG